MVGKQDADEACCILGGAFCIWYLIEWMESLGQGCREKPLGLPCLACVEIEINYCSSRVVSFYAC